VIFAVTASARAVDPVQRRFIDVVEYVSAPGADEAQRLALARMRARGDVIDPSVRAVAEVAQ